MLGVIIFIGIIALLFFIQTLRDNTPTYKTNPIYKRLVAEDKLKVDLTIALEEVIKTSLSLSKEQNLTEYKTNLNLVKNANKFRTKLHSDIFTLASKYRLPVNSVKKDIDNIFDDIITIYVTDFKTNSKKYTIIPLEGQHRLMFDLMKNVEASIELYLSHAKQSGHPPDRVKDEILDRIDFFKYSLIPKVQEVAIRFNISTTEVLETIQTIEESMLSRYIYK